MEVIYEPPILDRVKAAAQKAMVDGRTIAVIILTEAEWEEVGAWFSKVARYQKDGSFYENLIAGRGEVFGIKIRRALPEQAAA